MNSKLYQKYLSLKIEDPDFVYLFETKNYYFFIADDAIKMSSLLNLKLTNFSSIIMMCEFSSASFNEYFDKINELNIKVKTIPLSEDIFNYDLEKCFNSFKYNELISNFLNIKIDNLSISQAYDLLKYLQKKLKDLKK